jgi:bifunctional DNase/RNase
MPANGQDTAGVWRSPVRGPTGPGPPEGGAAVVEMQVEAIGQEPGGHQYFLILRERGGERRLVLGIGPFEAEAIARAVAEVPVPRPLTHDLLAHTIARLGGQLQRVLIHDVRDHAFIGQMEVSTDRGLIELDCRPSDGVAVALRTRAPIFADEEILEKAGITPGSPTDSPPDAPDVIS